MKFDTKKIESWIKEAIPAINNLILRYFSDHQKVPYVNEFLRYTLEKTPLLCIGISQTKLRICAVENKITRSKPWQKTRYINLTRVGFTRSLEIPKEKVYRNNLQEIENYLEAVRKKKT